MPYELNYTFHDSQAKGAFTMKFYSRAANEAAAIAESADIRDAILTLIDCTLAKRSVENVLQQNRIRPAGNVDGEKKGLFTFITAAGKTMQRGLPGFKSSYFIPGTDLIDLENPDVQAFVDAVIAGTINDSNDSDISGIESAVKQFRQRQN